MALRQESAPEETGKRTYNKTGRDVVGVPKFRSGADWEKMPDYERLPHWALVNMSEVAVLTGMAHSAIERRIREGSFAPPNKHGKNRVWSLGYVRQWCEQFGQHFPAEGGE
jgi:predicted DNA-binding transcriptional regulator AlpA